MFPQGPTAPLEAGDLSTDAVLLVRNILATGDHQGRAFAVVDKRSAQILLFHGDGRPAGSSTVLLGLTPGDVALPGVGQRTQTGRLLPQDRTTPAGRFESEPGRNLAGEPVVWLDYAAAFAIHRLRQGPSQEQRLRRMASLRSADKRISAGCVVVPVAFYEQAVQPLLGAGRGVVYVMPEARPWQSLWQESQARSGE